MTSDLTLDADGDLALTPGLVTATDLVLQRIGVRLRTFRGDWVLDTTQGLPISEWLQTKPPPVPAIVALVRREIATTPGVVRVVEISGAYARETRQITITGEVLIEDAEDPVGLTITTASGDAPNALPFTLLVGPR